MSNTTSWELDEEEEASVIKASEMQITVGDIVAEDLKGKPITISREVYQCIEYCMDKFDKEWAAWLNRNEDGVVDDIYFPEQTPNTTTMDFYEDTEGEYEGFMHSHHDMDVSFSGHDEKESNSAFQFALLARNGTGGVRLNGVRKIKVADISDYLDLQNIDEQDFVKVECEVEVKNDNIEWWQEQVDENTVKESKKTTTISGLPKRGGYSGSYGPGYSRYEGGYTNWKPQSKSGSRFEAGEEVQIFQRVEAIKLSNSNQVWLYNGSILKIESVKNGDENIYVVENQQGLKYNVPHAQLDGKGYVLR